MSLILNSIFNRCTVANLFSPPIRTGTKRGPTRVRSEGSSPGPALIINHEKLSPLLGRPTGKSKFMCVQFCLSVAEISSSAEAAGAEDTMDTAMDVDMNTEGDGEMTTDMGSDSTFVVPTVFQEELKALSVDRTAESNSEEEEGNNSEGNSGSDSSSDTDTDSDDALSPPSSSQSAPLEEAKVAALKGLNDRSGTSAVYCDYAYVGEELQWLCTLEEAEILH
jgi:hypothetical protein